MDFTCRRCRLALTCLTVLSIFIGIDAQAIIGPSPPVDYIEAGDEHILSCGRGPDGAAGFVSWEFSEPGSTSRSTLFIDDARQDMDERYDNFAIDPNNLYDLIITSMSVEDEGTFYCRNLGITGSEVSVVRTVEVAGPDPVMSPISGDTVTVTTGISTTITCTATAYKPAVTIQWFEKKATGEETQITEGVNQTEEPNAGDSNLFDVKSTLPYSSTKEYNGGELRCATSGQNAAQSKYRTATLNVQYEPEITYLEYSEEQVTCSSDANPEVPEPSGYKIIVNDTDEYTPTCTDGTCLLELKVDYDTDVRCNATNVLGTGSKTIVAIPGAVITTPKPTTPEKTTNGNVTAAPLDNPPGPNIGAIVGGIIGGLLFIVVVVLLVYFLVVKKGKNKSKSGGGSEMTRVNGSGAEKSKDRPVPAPRNSTGNAHDNEEGKKVKPNDDPDNLVYAQVDHSKKPPTQNSGNDIIRTEPATEYADVKTFIV